MEGKRCQPLTLYPVFSQGRKASYKVVATPDLVLGDSSSAITAAASFLGNLSDGTRLHRSSHIASLISSLFYHGALDIQKLSLSPETHL